MIGKTINRYKIIGNINNRVVMAHNPNAVEPWQKFSCQRIYGESILCNKVNPRCKGCGHRRPLNHSNNKGYSICYYILDTGQPRDCTVEECTHYTNKECHIKEDLWTD